MPNTTEAKARRSGRQIALAIFGALVGGFIVVASGNVIWQIWGPMLMTRPDASCAIGLRELVLSVDRAREAASSSPEESESAALARFRSALRPEWDGYALVAASCAGDRELSAALDTIERLRYAEEHAVRLEASELAPLRLAVRKLMNDRLGPPTQ